MWQLTHITATLKTDGICAKVELLKPWLGLQNVGLRGEAVPGVSLLGVDLLATDWRESNIPPDVYVRKTDLVATYDQLANRSVRPEIYWRVLRSGFGFTGVELILSLETSLLDSTPTARFLSTIAATSIYHGKPGQLKQIHGAGLNHQTASLQTIEEPAIILCRLANEQWSYVEIVGAADCKYTQIEVDRSAPGVIRLHHDVLAERLEKGVIRRGRMRGIFVPREDDQRSASTCYKDLLDSPLPLTT